jgi:hypothetical protein
MAHSPRAGGANKAIQSRGIEVKRKPRACARACCEPQIDRFVMAITAAKACSDIFPAVS